ncbi:MAG: AsmA family protein [Burkholderiales bacterium]
MAIAHAREAATPAGWGIIPHMISLGPDSLFRRVLRWASRIAFSVIAIGLAVAFYIASFGITLNAAALRQSIATTFSDNIGRPVRLDGPLELEISAQPSLRVGGLHIANAPGFEGGDFASLGEARLALDLWPLLFEKKLRIDELSGSRVKLRLQRNADGRGNWTFAPRIAAPAPIPPPPKSDNPTAIGAEQAVSALDIQRISLEQLNVEYVGPDGVSHFFDLHKLHARSPSGQPFTMNLDGAVEKTFPYQLEFQGGRLVDLVGGKPWPIEMKLTFLSTILYLHGTVSGNQGDIAFGLGTENLAEFERLTQTRLPDVGATGMAGTVQYSARKVALTQLSGAMGKTTLIGTLGIDSSGKKPKITGSLTLPTLDLRPFLHNDNGESAQPPASTEPPRSLSDLYRDLSTATFSLGQLNDADIDLTLAVQRWMSLPGDVQDVSLGLKLENGRLQAPVVATVTNVTLRGGVTADATATPPKFQLALGTQDSNLGGLAEFLIGARGIKGHLGRFDLKLGASGNQVSELVRSLDVGLHIRKGQFSYGNLEGGRPVDFSLHDFSLVLPAGKALTGDMTGTLLEHPFTAKLRGGALEPMMLGAQSPLDFSLRSGPVSLNIAGLLQAPTADTGPTLKFSVNAPQAGELASWFGFTPGAEAPIRLSGKATLRTTEWRLDDLSFRLGRSAISADLARTGIGSQPLLQVRLAAEQIDVKEIESLIPKSKKTNMQESEGPVLDIPILPQGIDLTDSDIEVRIARFPGSPLEVTDVSFDGRIREGYMHPSPFAVKMAGTALNGAVLLDLRGAEPRAGLWLFASNIDIGSMMRKLGMNANLEATFQEFGFHLMARASRLGDMLGRSELLGNIGGGRITLRDANTGAQARIALDKGQLRAEPGAPLRLNLHGAIDDVPILLGLETARAEDLLNPKLPLPFQFHAEAADTRVKLAGEIARPVGSELKLALDMQGTRFDNLNKLMRASLPPWGPWSAAGQFRMSSLGYAVDELRLQVGQSVLNGTGRLDTQGVRPKLDVTLSAPNIQLDNFRFGDWSPVEKKPVPETEKPLTAEELRAKAAQASQTTQKLLSPEVLRRQDAFLKVQVDQVLSGEDKLGSGRLEAKLENGRADIGPVEVNVPGGSAKFSLGYEPTDRDVKVDLHIDVDRFDYGILARRIKPETDLQGLFSLKMNVDSRAQYLADVLKNGNGRIEFAVWPKNMQAGIFDLWAVNILVALVPAVDPGKASKINCAIGRFQLGDGKLVEKSIVLDTSRMRVTGKGGADFNTENVKLNMRPQAKSAQFLSLSTPIEVSGTFTKFNIGVAPGGIIETVGRLATSILWVPFQKLAGKTIPADGSDVCNAGFDAVAPDS